MHILLISLTGIIIRQGSFQLLLFNKIKAKMTRSKSKRVHNMYKILLNIEKGRVRENSVSRLPEDLKKRQTATWSSAPPSTLRWRTRTLRLRTSRARRSRSGSRWRQWRLLPTPPSLRTQDIQIKWTVGVKRQRTRFDLIFCELGSNIFNERRFCHWQILTPPGGVSCLNLKWSKCIQRSAKQSRKTWRHLKISKLIFLKSWRFYRSLKLDSSFDALIWIIYKFNSNKDFDKHV